MKFVLRLLHKLNQLRYSLTQPITVGVRALLLREQQVLLVKHTYEPTWYIPGGKVEKGETLEQAIRREVAEEVGATLGEVRLFGVYTNFYEGRSDHVIVFITEDFDVQGRKNIEIERFDYFAFDDLPQNTSPGSGRRIEEYVRGQKAAVIGKW